MALRLEMRLGLAPEPHIPLETPDLTTRASWRNIQLTKENVRHIIREDNDEERAAQTEAMLLSTWQGYTWQHYLDSPLVAHLDAALQLKDWYDAVIGIQSAGIPYTQMFALAGLPTFTADYSHHKRNMTTPEISPQTLEALQQKQSVLLVDIDIVTGKTITTIHDHLKERGVNVRGAYTGLTRWPGMNLDQPTLGTDTTNFDELWTPAQWGTRNGPDQSTYQQGILPKGLSIHTSDARVGEYEQEQTTREATERTLHHLHTITNDQHA